MIARLRVWLNAPHAALKFYGAYSHHRDQRLSHETSCHELGVRPPREKP